MQPNQDQDDSSAGIDLNDYFKKKADNAQENSIGFEKKGNKQADEPSWKQVTGEVLTQAGLGAAQAFTWPADVIKLGALFNSLGEMNALEAEAAEDGIPFDRPAYIKGVMESSRYVPTQKGAEEAFEHFSGISLEPKSEWGRRARQGAALFTLGTGTIAKKALSAATGVATTLLAKSLGASEGAGELIGDVVSVSPQAIEKGVKALTKEGKTAEKFELPFLEYMQRQKAPTFGAKITANNERILNEKMKQSSAEALHKIIKDEIPLSRYRDNGVDLNEFAKFAYDATKVKAASNPQKLNMNPFISKIDQEITHIQRSAPNPSDAQIASIMLLNRERDALAGSAPTSEQLINQHMNYNSNLKSLYKKPEFSGAENEIRTTYEFLKKGLVETMERQGQADVANMFKASNKIYHDSLKLTQSENIIAKAFPDEGWNPKALNKLLNSSKGKILERNLGPRAIEDFREIANYGEQAQKKMRSLLTKGKGLNDAPSWGQLAPIVLFNSTLGKGLGFAKTIFEYANGVLLTRPATRKIYKRTLKNAAQGAFGALKKDFFQLEQEIEKQWGSVDNFMDNALLESNPVEPAHND